ncbi:MAG: OmpA family protein [Rhodospirillales bacterium]|nr:OmpA family protein [Rhodospirillales bacterium]
MAAVLAVTGCYGFKYDHVKDLQPKGSPFDQALYEEYLNQSKNEFLGSNYQMSDKWADKAEMAAAGKTPSLSPASDWETPSGLTSELSKARSDYEALLSRACQNKAPVEMAKAQVALDCLYEQTRVQENFQAKDIAACRTIFANNLKKAAEICAPKAAAPMKPSEFLVFFDWNKSNLTPEAMKIVTDAVAAAKQKGAKTIRIVGHTDTSGSAAYNLRLSERRAQAVAAQMIKLGVPATSIVTVGRGQEDPLVPTPDGVREPQNRRASIGFAATGATSGARQFVHIDVVN